MSGEQHPPDATPPPVGEFRPGESFAGYRIDGIVGRGGMGVVYRATELSLGRSIALKVVAPALVGDALARRRFVREARAAAAIEHPNVIPVHAAGERDGVAFLAMRLISGDDLRTLVRREGALPPARAARFVGQIAAALDAAHAVGIVHRDVKPGNILVAPGDHTYLTDFGLTAFLDSSSTASGAGHWVGTPDFAAPEQIRGERPDARTDVYALGCVLYFLLTARAPFVRGGQEAKLWAHLTEEPPPLGIGMPELDAVVVRALAKQPDERYASAGDLGRAVVAAVAGEPAAPEDGSVAVGSAAADEPATQALTLEAPTVAQPPDRRSGRGAVLAAAAVAVLAGASVVAVIALAGGGPSPTRPAAVRATPTPTPTAFGARRVAGAPAGSRPTSLALAANRMWVGERRRPVVRSFEPATLRQLRRAALPSGISELVASPGALWATLWRAQAIARLDPRTGRVVGSPIQLPGIPSTLAVGGGSLWVGLTAPTRGGFATIMRIDRKSGAVVWAKQLQRQADRLVWLNGSLWAMVSTPNRLFRIDAGGTIREGFDLPGSDAADLTAAADGRLWATVRAPDWLVRIDPRTGQRAVAFVGRSPTGVSVHRDDVWVGLSASSQVVRIDAHSLKRRGRPVDVALNPFELTADASGVWVICPGNGRVVRVRKL